RERGRRRRTHRACAGGRRRGSDSVADLGSRAGRPEGGVGHGCTPLAGRRLSAIRRQVVPAERNRPRAGGGGSVSAFRHPRQVAFVYISAILRQPAWVGISLVQPVIWLLLFGALFKRTVDIPGFTSGSYIEFLTPGVVVMLAVSAAGWVGMGFIDDIHRGTMDRLVLLAIWRGALNLGSVAQSVLSIVIQSVIVIGLALAVGARFHDGVAGMAALVVVAGLLGAVFASLSNGVAVLTRQRETLIGIVTLVTLPLTFLSAALMQQSLLPGWFQWLAPF